MGLFMTVPAFIWDVRNPGPEISRRAAERMAHSVLPVLEPPGQADDRKLSQPVPFDGANADAAVGLGQVLKFANTAAIIAALEIGHIQVDVECAAPRPE